MFLVYDRFFYQLKPVLGQKTFWLTLVFLGNASVFLSACQPKEKNNPQTQVVNEQQNMSVPSQFETIAPPASTSVADDSLVSSTETLDSEPQAVILDELTETQVIDSKRDYKTEHLDAMLEHYAVDEFLPNGAESEDFQQAYLANIYTMHHNNPVLNADDNADVAFVKNMILHRQGAINLAKLQLDYGNDDSLKYFAKDIIATQENDIWLMTHWLKEIYPNQPKTQKPHQQNIQQEFANSVNQMHEQMLIGALQDDADMVFIQTMLPYHKGALALAQVELKYGTDPKVRGLADDIIMNQIPEIQFMQKWLKEHR